MNTTEPGKPGKARSARAGEAPLDIGKILHRRIQVVQGGVTKGMHPAEASIRSVASKAIGGCMRAAKRFLKQCESAGLFEMPEALDDHVYVHRVPKEWDYDEWRAKFDELGPPPWPGERDGLIPADRREQDGRWTNR
ncbi:hypothetical protein OF829_12560 [Sphingomonas sp. LB-2]|uniref:hypothetical protein n=1 Tax=Sphingomonas caeni TaxID=2984949 RepID=UPI002232C1E0|nr:hypothetical protein [Sphingomonas caeni]MCW3848074.1 hypothetical protein [Sphingomonas caeni]